MNARDQLAGDIQRALNWASIDAKANMADYELAEQMVDAPSLRGYLKPSEGPVETGVNECAMAELSEESKAMFQQRKADQSDLINWILHYKNPADDETKLRQIRLVME